MPNHTLSSKGISSIALPTSANEDRLRELAIEYHFPYHMELAHPYAYDKVLSLPQGFLSI